MRLRVVPAIAFAALLALNAIDQRGSAGEDLIADDNLAGLVVGRLDVPSFPSSIGPRRAAGKTTFADYGFFPVTMNSNTAVLEPPEHDWRFEIRVLRHGQHTIIVCLHDKALNGGTYDAQELLVLHPVDSPSRLVAERAGTPAAGCPQFSDESRFPE